MTQTNKKQSISLTQRDKDIFVELASAKGLTTDQLLRLFFPSRVKCNQRTLKLHEHNYLGRFEVDLEKMRIANGSKRTFMFTLDKLGAEVVAKELGKPLEHFWNPKDTIIPTQELPHMIYNNDVRIALKLAVETLGYSIARWETDHTLRRRSKTQKLRVEYTPTYKIEDGTISGEIIPDDLIIMNTLGRDYIGFLEIDTGTEVRSHPTRPKGVDTSIATKVRKYMALLHKRYKDARSKAQAPSVFETQAGIADQRGVQVIFLTAGGDKAAENLVATIRKAGGKNTYMVGRYELARREDFVLTRPIFRRVGDTSNRLYPWVGKRKVDMVADLLRQQAVPESVIAERIQQINQLAQSQLKQGWYDTEIGFEQALALRVDELAEATIEKFEALVPTPTGEVVAG